MQVLCLISLISKSDFICLTKETAILSSSINLEEALQINPVNLKGNRRLRKISIKYLKIQLLRRLLTELRVQLMVTGKIDPKTLSKNSYQLIMRESSRSSKIFQTLTLKLFISVKIADKAKRLPNTLKSKKEIQDFPISINLLKMK